MDELKQRQADHLKRLLNELNEQGITQKMLAETIHVSEVSVSRWKNGRASIRPDYARAIHDAYPDYSVEYLIGYSDYPNEDTQKRAERNERINRVFLLLDCIEGLLKLNDVDFRNGAEIARYDDNQNIVDFECFYALSKDGKSLTLTGDQWVSFQKEVLGYVGLRVNQLLERGAW